MQNSADQLRDKFEDLVEPLLTRGAGFAYSIVGHRADAEDAVQDALVQGFQRFGSFDPSRSFKAWWFALIRNRCLDLLRRRRLHPTRGDAGEIDSFAAHGRDCGVQHDLLESLALLSPAHQEILELRYYGDCSYREIAEAVSIPEGTVMSRLHAARQALAAIYRKDER
jgi:RNA polymerase sigma-70 factor (ECF subfamily)